MAQVPINYAVIAAKYLAGHGNGSSNEALSDEFKQELFEDLPGLWCGAYSAMPNSGVEIVQVRDNEYEFLFDCVADRVVAAFGFSRKHKGKRDSSRMSGYLGKTTSKKQMESLVDAAPAPEQKRRRHLAGLSFRERFFETHGDKYDRGHFMSHRQGGGLDINLFPQRADINQGHGIQGAAYRAMERRCAGNTGLFCFSRPIYGDETWVPYELEYGVISGPTGVDIQRFPNR